MKLNELKPPQGARHSRKRLGCGTGSGHGKTAGKGHKGQKARAGGFVRLGPGDRFGEHGRRVPQRSKRAQERVRDKREKLVDLQPAARSRVRNEPVVGHNPQAGLHGGFADHRIHLARHEARAGLIEGQRQLAQQGIDIERELYLFLMVLYFAFSSLLSYGGRRLEQSMGLGSR